jgi:hypothetical protein
MARVPVPPTEPDFVISYSQLQAALLALPVISVAEYGALGDGTDQQAALQDAIDALPANGGVLEFPEPGGRYYYSSQLNFDGKRGVVLRGRGAGSAGLATGTTLAYTGDGSGAAISARSTLGFTVYDMWLTYTDGDFTGTILDISLSSSVVSQPSLQNVRIGSSASAPYLALGLSLNKAQSGTFINCNFDLNGRAVQGLATHDSFSVRQAFYGCRFANSDEKHVMNVGEGWLFSATTVQQLSIGVGESKAGWIGYDPGFIQRNLTIDSGWAGDVDQVTSDPQIEFAGKGLTINGFEMAGGGAGALVDVKPPVVTLVGAINSSATTITVDHTHVLSSSGTLLIDSEEITYTSTTATTFTGCTRGANGTSPASHSDGADVSLLDQTEGIDIDAGTYFHFAEFGVALRRGVKSGSANIRARGKVGQGGSGELTATVLWEQDVTAGAGVDAGYRGVLIPRPEESPHGDNNLTTGNSIAANRALLQRFVPPRDMKILSAAFGVAVAATNDDAMDLGIYTVSNGALTRIASVGATTGKLNATGVKTVTFASPVYLQRGRIYYVALSYGAIGGTAANLAGVTMTSNFYVGYLAPRSSVEFYVGAWKDASHPLPPTLSALTFPVNNVPKIGLREF